MFVFVLPETGPQNTVVMLVVLSGLTPYPQRFYMEIAPSGSVPNRLADEHQFLRRHMLVAHNRGLTSNDVPTTVVFLALLRVLRSPLWT